jgi:hypothetical protein
MVDATAVSKFTIITSGSFIGTGEDFEFNWELVMPTQILDILHVNHTPSGIGSRGTKLTG